MTIDWSLLGRAVEYFGDLGFEYVDTPWMVDADIAAITCPSERYFDRVETNGKILVASAEQGFLQMELEGNLSGVNYISVGPCFRIQDAHENPDGFHQETFAKAELYVRCKSIEQATEIGKELAIKARNFLTLDAEIVKQSKTSWDLELNGIEIGSYGGRAYNDICWAYGTAVALPRYTQAQSAPERLHY